MAIVGKFITPRAREALSAALSLARARMRPLVDWALDVAPIVGRIAVERRNRIVLAPYRRQYSLNGTIAKIVIPPILAVTCLVYGFFYGLAAPGSIVPCIVPIFVLAAMIIWALPHQRSAPTLGIEFLYPAFFVALVVWPNYLAISLPGLPWITILRLIALPMVMLFLISLSISPQFQHRTNQSVNGVKLTWIMMRGFILVQILTLPISKSFGPSAQLVFNDQVYFTSIYVIGSILFRKLDNVERYFNLLCILAIPIIILISLETTQQHLLWMTEIPKFLQIQDATVKRILIPTFRAGTHFFRSKATFATPLETAEYLGILTPLFLYFGFNSRNYIYKIFSFSMIPAIFIAIRLTDSRLGIVGMLVSFLLYGMLWSIVRWRSRSRDLVAAAVVYAYPILFIAAVGLIFSSHTMHDMVLGGNAQAGSNDARNNQLTMGWKGFSSAPWGHGAGQSGGAMGYADVSQITIDNFFVSLELDYGALGIFFWYGMFVVAIWEAIRHCISSRYASTREARLLAPIAVALSAFLVMKWVHAGEYNHPIAFMMLGMISALIYNVRERVSMLPASTLPQVTLTECIHKSSGR